MNYRDQKKQIDALKRYENKMDKKDLEDYNIFVKRQKDDDDFDTIYFTKLSDLYVKYYVNRPKKSLDSLLKKPENNE